MGEIINGVASEYETPREPRYYNNDTTSATGFPMPLVNKINTETTTVSKKCDDCKHESICKFIDEMESVQIGVYAIGKSTKSPINIDVSCNTYERMTKKQDGIVYR